MTPVSPDQMPDEMMAALVRAAGAVPVHAPFERPVAAPGEVVVTMAAAALSQLTRMRASGRHYSSAGAFPLVPGVDGVGRLPDGRRVYVLLPRAPFGTMAEQSCVPEGHWIAVPDALGDAEAAALANPGMSSWAALAERAHFQPGERVLINGASGTSGRLAVAIARHMGASQVVATGRNAAALASLGADAVEIIDGAAPDTLAAQLESHFAAGIDVVLDYLWGAPGAAVLTAAAKAATARKPVRFVQIGSIAGAEISLNAAILRSSALQIMGSGLGSVPTPRLLAAIDAVFSAAAHSDPDKALRVAHDPVPLTQVAETWNTGEGRIVYLIDR